MKDLNSFTAIDFETACGEYNSICQIGLVRVEQGKIVHTINQLVKPPNNYYHWGNVRVHGIKKMDTINQPTFDKLWHLIEPFITNDLVVAHNASFDVNCLKKTLAYYEMPIPPFSQACTYKIYKSGLKKLSEKYQIELNHHDALSDAMACAQLYLNYLNNENRIINN
ncbi:MAG TPA: 3'-5' exonuclease [Edaphocola sp.]|nr:3'-5' exonuclease [Edaphocola sp.]